MSYLVGNPGPEYLYIASGLSIPSKFSISYWIKLQLDTDEMLALLHDPSSADSLDGSGFLASLSTVRAVYNQTLFPHGPKVLGAWQHRLATFDADIGETRHYVDGASSGPVLFTPDVAYLGFSSMILGRGSLNDGIDYQYEGRFAEIAIFNEVLPEDDADLLFSGRIPDTLGRSLNLYEPLRDGPGVFSVVGAFLDAADHPPVDVTPAPPIINPGASATYVINAPGARASSEINAPDTSVSYALNAPGASK